MPKVKRPPANGVGVSRRTLGLFSSPRLRLGEFVEGHDPKAHENQPGHEGNRDKPWQLEQDHGDHKDHRGVSQKEELRLDIPPAHDESGRWPFRLKPHDLVRHEVADPGHHDEPCEC